jgi:pimeloyl-ACP methyl ester carboxylesterase
MSKNNTMRQPFLSWLTDRIILEPSRREIAVPHKRRVLLSHGDGHIEAWVHRTGLDAGTRDPDLYVLKFPGTASRAEDSTDMVDNCWPDLSVEVWAVNPPGYGGSTGTASLHHIPSMASHALGELRLHTSGRPLVVAGGSLGCVSALYLAARHDVDGVLAQNPPALREVIQAQSGWWHFAWMRAVIARQIPETLDSIRNAAETRVPAVFLVARQDRIVPAMCQQQIIDAYAGPKRVLYRSEADHDTPLHEGDVQQLRELAAWLNQAIRR